MFTEKLKELVANSDLPQMQKNIIQGFVHRAESSELKQDSDRKLIELIANEKKLCEVVLSTDDVKIYTIIGRDDWDVKYPYRSIVMNKDGKWDRVCTVSPTLDTAILVYLNHKHLGLNSQFVDFALKMLEIKLIED